MAADMRDSMTVMPAAVELNLWKKRLEIVPDWVWERTELETLILADNELTEISERIGDCRGCGRWISGITSFRSCRTPSEI